MTTDHISVSGREVMKDLTIEFHLSGMKSLRFRLWLVTRLIKLIHIILRCHVKVFVNYD